MFCKGTATCRSVDVLYYLPLLSYVLNLQLDFVELVASESAVSGLCSEGVLQLRQITIRVSTEWA